ncbi:hypothetical protein [Vibrio sp. D431a]|uniref:hypothetical protein n=1 Tax=Vibrio sp. D431a TaxID=2837388 RepID=UPI0025547005|nr:hypothetical protein [Vibrio sp. D431a]MDK9789749.1 hypothetical protein [Vibrio sp. D431a]
MKIFHYVVSEGGNALSKTLSTRDFKAVKVDSDKLSEVSGCEGCHLVVTNESSPSEDDQTSVLGFKFDDDKDISSLIDTLLRSREAMRSANGYFQSGDRVQIENELATVVSVKPNTTPNNGELITVVHDGEELQVTYSAINLMKL